MLIYSCFGDCRCCYINFGYVRYVEFGENRQQLVKSTAKSPSRGLGSHQWSHSRYNLTVPWSMTRPSWRSLCAQPCRMWNRLHFPPFLQVSQNFQRRKSNANKQDFENKLNLTCQNQSTLKTIGILTKVFCTFGLNLVVLVWTDDELLRGQAQHGVNFDFEGKFDLEDKSQSPPKQ